MAENIGEVYVELVTFEAEGEPTGYMAINTQNITSRGIVYYAADAHYEPPKKTGNELTNASIVFSNVSRDLIDGIRAAHEDPQITVELVAVSRPDNVVDSEGPIELENVSYTTSAIQAEAGYLRVFDEQFPSGLYLPTWFPGLFTD